ncbi:MAG: hisC 3 [Firmicutes bacterium]|nr:hisC 3 [Bacillota bacterium]
MSTIEEKFSRLGMENAPGQESRSKEESLDLRGEPLLGRAVDFSHGDVDAFTPIPGSLNHFINGVENIGGRQAYTEYRGGSETLSMLSEKLSLFTGCAIDAKQGMILTPGTQGALFLAMGALVGRGDKVAIVEPDYFANRKLVEFFDGQLVPVKMDYFGCRDRAGLDLDQLENAFRSGVKLFLFSNPNNPVGAVYSPEEIHSIAELAGRYGVSLIVDELYSRQIFDGRRYTHLCAEKNAPAQMVTILGPSKTESMSGYRLGVAFGSPVIIERMEKLQAIVSLRAAGYCQAVFASWFNEPEGWMAQRIAEHQQIRDDLVGMFSSCKGVQVRPTEAGSYLFPQLPPLDVDIKSFVKILRCHAQVTVTPGTEFGPQFTNSIRLNFSQDAAAARAAVERLLCLIERYRVYR